MKYLTALLLACTASSAHALGITTSGDGNFAFGQVAVGTSVTRTVRLSATLDNPAMPYFSWNPWGLWNVLPPFSLSSGCMGGFSLTPGPCIISVTFSPTTSGFFGPSWPPLYDDIALHPIACNQIPTPVQPPGGSCFYVPMDFMVTGEGIAHAPGPVLGAGLPALLVAGALLWWRRKEVMPNESA